MRDNPILILVKTLAFVTLALLVLLSFIQGNKQESRAERLGERISKVETGLDRINTTLAKLDRRIAEGAPLVGPGARAPSADATVSVPPPGRMEEVAWDPTPPAWMKGRARELWGSYGENYLRPDPAWPDNPSLDDPKLDPDGSLTLWYGTAPSDLNPLTLSDGNVTRYVRNYVDDTWADAHSQNPYLYRPALAYRVEHSPDYRTWVFWIRPGVRWHAPQVDLARYPHLKGDHFLTAHDWKFTMDLIMNPDVRAAHLRAYFVGFDRCEVVDDHCFLMHWHKSQFSSISSNLDLIAPIAKFVYGSDERGSAFEPASIGARFNEHWFARAFKWVGTSRYVLTKYDPESEMVVVRNGDYWGEPPAIREMRREMFPDRDLAYTKFEAGEHASITYLAPQWKKRVVPNDNYTSGRWGEHWGWSTQYAFIAYKNTHPIFRDVRVRHAMTHACNRQRVLEAVNEGRGAIVTGPQSMHGPTYPKDLQPLAFDLDKARAILAEVGWTDADQDGVLEKEIDGVRTEFRVKAMIPETAMWNTIFSIFSEDLAKIGVRLELEPLQWSQFSKRLDDRSFDVTALLWDTTGWDSDMTQIWHSKMVEEPESSNFIEFADAEVDRLIDLARETFDLQERVKVQSDGHRRIHALQPYTFLYTIQLASMYWKDQLSDMSASDKWRSRPFSRLWPLWVPSAEPSLPAGGPR